MAAQPDRLRGTGFSALGLVQSFGDLGAPPVAGLLWAAVSTALAFGHAPTWMALPRVASVFLARGDEGP